MNWSIAVTTCLLMSSGCAQSRAAADYEVVAEFSHDPGAYTQGLLFTEGWLVESTGKYGHSDVRRVNLSTGQVEILHRLPAERFGEGLTRVGAHLLQLTWKSEIAYVYAWPNGALRDSFRLEGEGWGLAFDGTALIVSDGTSRLRFLDPTSYEVVRTVEVLDAGQPVTQLNELEFVRGQILANVYRTDWIVSIDPHSGGITDRYSLRGLRSYDPAGEQVLNGIAYDEAGNRLFVTGKYWPTLFHIRLRGNA